MQSRLRLVLAGIGIVALTLVGVRSMDRHGWLPAWMPEWLPGRIDRSPFAAVPWGPPCADGVSSFTFFAMGDTGDDTRRRARAAEALAERARRDGPGFVALLGDNFYPAGVDASDSPRFARDFEEAFPVSALPLPFEIVLGNHDHEGSVAAQLDYVSPTGRWRLPAPYRSFRERAPDGAEVEFFVLDTTPIAAGAAEAQDQLAWLGTALAACDADWRIVLGHHTLASAGHHGVTRALHERLAPLFRTHPVDLYLSGHDHNLQVLQPEGGPLVVVSGSGSRLRPVDPTGETLFCEAAAGFVRVRADRARLCVAVFSLADDNEGSLRFERHVTRATGAACPPRSHAAR